MKMASFGDNLYLPPLPLGWMSSTFKNNLIKSSNNVKPERLEFVKFDASCTLSALTS